MRLNKCCTHDYTSQIECEIMKWTQCEAHWLSISTKKRSGRVLSIKENVISWDVFFSDTYKTHLNVLDQRILKYECSHVILRTKHSPTVPDTQKILWILHELNISFKKKTEEEEVGWVWVFDLAFLIIWCGFALRWSVDTMKNSKVQFKFYVLYTWSSWIWASFFVCWLSNVSTFVSMSK